ncbi:polysaccharide export protein [Xanthobacter dioxanivorans]|uniref:Polysaccharide export protein n=1 Tax=Xanthobacter dioxanivorans TaxID=2528964 RepID=A0A974SH32_9HYPH|nr:polysaccharide biosynthesis/export family protein [Xanthobacter dioxanivorans]QRG05290.1 polysaccharide export protein [Xanthobacter dioxanivorans]
MQAYARILAFALLCGSLLGCTALPSSGPSRVDLETAQPEDDQRYLLVDVDDRTLYLLAQERPATFGARFGDYRPPSRYVVGVGDSLTVTIWEAAAGGLFSGPVIDRLGTGSRSAAIPEQQVAQDGSITVPYAGRIPVAGKTTAQIEATIVDRLSGKAIEPQVVVVVSKSVSNAATVLGEVTTGAVVPLSPRGDRVLDVIAAAGGIKVPAHEVFVRLSRSGATVTVPMQVLLNNPAEDVYVRPQDKIVLIRDPQTFTVFGAAGNPTIVPFDAVGITLEESIARVGGLLDARADPSGVYLMRIEPVRFAAQLRPDARPLQSQGYVRVIYRWNMRDPNALFLARSFQIRNKDAIYIANAPLADLQKITSLFNAVAQPVVSTAVVAQ